MGLAAIQLEFGKTSNDSRHGLVKFKARSGIGMNVEEPGDSSGIVGTENMVFHKDVVTKEVIPDWWMRLDSSNGDGSFEENMEFGSTSSFGRFSKKRLKRSGSVGTLIEAVIGLVLECSGRGRIWARVSLVWMIANNVAILWQIDVF